MDSEGDGSAFWGMLLTIRDRCQCPLWHHQVPLFQAMASVFLAGFTFLISAKTVDTFRSGNVAKVNFCSAWGLRTDSTSLRSVWLRPSSHTSELVCLLKTIPVASWTLLRFYLPAGLVRRGFLPYLFIFQWKKCRHSTAVRHLFTNVWKKVKQKRKKNPHRPSLCRLVPQGSSDCSRRRPFPPLMCHHREWQGHALNQGGAH